MKLKTPTRQIEYAIREARSGHRNYASVWLPVLDHWIGALEAGQGQSFPVTLKAAEGLRRRLEAALIADPLQGGTSHMRDDR